MTPLERIERTASALKIFPLPSGVLFPTSVIPLHIFEPRYREMVRAALEDDRVLALGQLVPGKRGSDAEHPAIAPMCCAGVIAWHEELAEGRFNIVLQGVVRARILAEPPSSHPYREVRTELLPDPVFTGQEEELVRQAVLELGARLPTNVAQSLLQAAAHAQGGALADIVASAVVPDAERRQSLLNELDVKRRLLSVLMDVSDVIGRVTPVRPEGLMN